MSRAARRGATRQARAPPADRTRGLVEAHRGAAAVPRQTLPFAAGQALRLGARRKWKIRITEYLLQGLQHRPGERPARLFDGARRRDRRATHRSGRPDPADRRRTRKRKRLYHTSPFSLRFVAPSQAYASMMYGQPTMMIELIMVADSPRRRSCSKATRRPWRTSACGPTGGRSTSSGRAEPTRSTPDGSRGSLRSASTTTRGCSTRPSPSDWGSHDR